MLTRLRQQIATYPPQFWLMFWGMLISVTGVSMIWPFLMIYISGQLDKPMAQIASLMSLNAIMGVVAAFLAGPTSDRLGRKWVMILSLAGNGLVYFLFGQASTWLHFALLLAFWGFFGPMYRVGSDAMLAEIIPEEHRADAYALSRMSTNVGIALGPAIGGILASTSYDIAFVIAACSLVGYGLVLALFAHETLPERTRVQTIGENPWRAYNQVLRDTYFLRFAGLFVLVQMCAVFVWLFMGVYAKTQYGLPENLFGLIAATNATMVVLFQFSITLRVKHYRPLRMMALGTLLYGLGVGSVVFARDFWGFWISIIILTIGEMIVVPTASAYAANLAPEAMRGRYMSIYNLSWNAASGIAAPIGGWISDVIGPVSVWFGGLAVGLAGAAGFWRLQNRQRLRIKD